MTHSQHRRGSTESLAKDFVVLSMSAKGYNDKAAPAKFKEILDIFHAHNPANLGDIKTGSLCQKVAFEKIRERTTDSAVHAVFTSLDELKEVMKDLKRADPGISVVASGLFSEVLETAREAGLKPDSVGISLGIWGATELLPPEDILEIITMCGHGMVSTNLVKSLADDIRAGKLTVEEAGMELGRGCNCGIFNPVRAAELLRKI